MIGSVGENISNLPWGELTLVNELMSFDGTPIVIHFTNERKEDILAYWVDYDNNSVRWLYTKVTKGELYKYLKGLLPLKKIFKEIKSEYIFFVDLASNGTPNQIKFSSSYLIPDEYFPDEMSYYSDGLSKFYLEYLSEFEYDNLLKERAYVIKGEPSNLIHGNFLSAKDGALILNSIRGSIEGYVSVVAKNKYEKKYTSVSRINRVVKTITEHLSPLITQAAIGSFEIWLAMDTITLNDVDEIGSEIKAGIIEGYKNDVLDVDFTSAEDAKIICEKYNPVDRKRIYEPIMNILENDKIDLKFSDKKKTLRQIDKPIKTNSKFRDLVLPKPSVEELLLENEKKKRLFTLVLSLDEGTDITKVGRREIVDNLLLFNDNIEIPYPINFTLNLPNGLVMGLNKPIIGNLKIKDADQLELTSDELGIDVVAKEIKELIELFKNEFMKVANRQKNYKEPTAINEYLDLSSF